MNSKLLLGFVLAAGAAQAALPPFHQRNNEIEAVIRNSDVESAVTAHSATSRGGSGEIDSVTRTSALRGTIGGNLFRVTSGRCILDVTVQYEFTPGIVGPPELKLSSKKDMTCPGRR